ncbi:hypothetical protein [Streptomyces sp. NPDC097640]|uniref:hypothetical protein n=1 Tax=Streptomyces sp. NPDC097640 TaxID=3157229 RepID=UPI003323D4A7
MDNPWLMMTTVVTMGVLRLIGDVIRWLAARSGERVRARMLVELMTRSGPGTVLTDHRADGAALTVRSGSAGSAGSSGSSPEPAAGAPGRGAGHE